MSRDKRVSKWWVFIASVIVVSLAAAFAYEKVSEHNHVMAEQAAAARKKAREKAFKDAVLERAYTKCNVYTESDAALHDTMDLASGNDSLELYSPNTALNTYDTYSCIAEQTSMPQSVQDKIGQTNAYSGMQSDSWDNIKATWSYNGNTGLSITLERTK